MNSIEAKKINLPELMSRLGYQPTNIKKGGNEYWYNSPFRPEKDASFHTSFLGGKWIWNDFGDSGGTVIDFVMRHENYYSVSQALKYLDDMVGKVGASLKSKSSSFQQQVSATSKISDTNELEFISAIPIQNPIILSYLTNERYLDKSIVLKYLQEVRYRNLNNKKEYFAFGMQNESNGYEIRVASDKYPFKSALIRKDISLIRGFKSNRVVNIFEGMTDFLSLLTIMKTDNLFGDSIIMHSLSSYQKTLDIISQGNYDSLNSYLDNNKSGWRYTEKLKMDVRVQLNIQSSMFLPYVDINDWLISKRNRS